MKIHSGINKSILFVFILLFSLYIVNATTTYDVLLSRGAILKNLTGWSASADSMYDTNYKSILAVDGKFQGRGTIYYWVSEGSFPHWINIDLKANQNINCTYFQVSNGEAAKVFNISYSTDNTTWNLVTPTTYDDFGGGWVNPTTNNSALSYPYNLTYSFQNVSARWIKLSAGTTGNSGYMSIWEIVFCNATNPPPSDTTPPDIKFISQTPSDLTSTNAISKKVNITYNISDLENNINLSTVFIFHKFNSTTRNVICFINETACPEWHNDSYISNISNTFLFQFDDNEIYPAIYNVNDDTTDDFLHTKQTLGNANQYVSTKFANLSSSLAYNFFEIMSNATIIQRLYYCNESYLFSSSVDTNTNCVLLETIPANQQYNHTHSQYSSHQLIPFFINTTSKTIGSIGVTEKSFFLLRGGAGTVNYYSVSNVTRINTTRTTTNGGGSWSNQAFTIDAHIHQFSGNSSLYYYVCGNDTKGNGNCSIWRNDTFELDNLPPTDPIVYNPINATYSGNISINYTASVPLSNASIGYYYIDLLNENFDYIRSIKANNSLNLSYLWDSSSIIYGNYIIRVTVVGTSGRTNQGYSDIFSINNIKFNIFNSTFKYSIIGKLDTNTLYTNIFSNYNIDKSRITLKYPNGTSVNYNIDNSNRTISEIYFNNSTIPITSNGVYIWYNNTNNYIFNVSFYYRKYSGLSSLNINVTFFYNNSNNIEQQTFTGLLAGVNKINTSFLNNEFINSIKIIVFSTGAGGQLDFSNITITGYNSINSIIINETSQIGQYNLTFVYTNTTEGSLYYNDYSANQYINFTVLQPPFNLLSLTSNCTFSNCSFNFIFDNTCNLNLTINGVLYNSSNNTNHNIFTVALSENTPYIYTYNVVDIFDNIISGTGVVATKSYSQLIYEDSIANQDFLMIIFILAILFILYIISEVFKISMLGTLAGIGLIIYSFTLMSYGIWFFIVLVFSGLVMLARSIFS